LREKFYRIADISVKQMSDGCAWPRVNALSGSIYRDFYKTVFVADGGVEVLEALCVAQIGGLHGLTPANCRV
jgi:hypothetical protein